MAELLSLKGSHFTLTLLHLEGPKLYGVLAVLSEIGLIYRVLALLSATGFIWEVKFLRETSKLPSFPTFSLKMNGHFQKRQLCYFHFIFLLNGSHRLP